MDIQIKKSSQEFIDNYKRSHLVLRASILPSMLKEEGFDIETEIKDGEMYYYYTSSEGNKIDITDSFHKVVDSGIAQVASEQLESSNRARDAVGIAAQFQGAHRIDENASVIIAPVRSSGNLAEQSEQKIIIPLPYR